MKPNVGGGEPQNDGLLRSTLTLPTRGWIQGKTEFCGRGAQLLKAGVLQKVSCWGIRVLTPLENSLICFSNAF